MSAASNSIVSSQRSDLMAAIAAGPPAPVTRTRARGDRGRTGSSPVCRLLFGLAPAPRLRGGGQGTGRVSSGPDGGTITDGLEHLGMVPVDHRDRGVPLIDPGILKIVEEQACASPSKGERGWRNAGRSATIRMASRGVAGKRRSTRRPEARRRSRIAPLPGRGRRCRGPAPTTLPTASAESSRSGRGGH